MADAVSSRWLVAKKKLFAWIPKQKVKKNSLQDCSEVMYAVGIYNENKRKQGNWYMEISVSTCINTVIHMKGIIFLQVEA